MIVLCWGWSPGKGRPACDIERSQPAEGPKRRVNFQRPKTTRRTWASSVLLTSNHLLQPGSSRPETRRLKILATRSWSFRQGRFNKEIICRNKEAIISTRKRYMRKQVITLQKSWNRLKCKSSSTVLNWNAWKSYSRKPGIWQGLEANQWVMDHRKLQWQQRSNTCLSGYMGGFLRFC